MTSGDVSVISFLKRINFRFYWLRRDFDRLCLTISNRKIDNPKYQAGDMRNYKKRGRI